MLILHSQSTVATQLASSVVVSILGPNVLDFDFENVTKIVAYVEERIRTVNLSHLPIDLVGTPHWFRYCYDAFALPPLHNSVIDRIDSYFSLRVDLYCDYRIDYKYLYHNLHLDFVVDLWMDLGVAVVVVDIVMDDVNTNVVLE